MEQHKQLSLEFDEGLINKILENVNMRYIILFLHIIRNDLFKDLSDTSLIESYNKVIMLDEIYKGNVLTFWEEWFIETSIDLGLIKNIRSMREFEQKDQDFVIKLGEETVTIEGDTISVPADILYLMITKKFPFLSRKNFNLALTQLKSVRCEYSGVIHPFIYQIGEEDYTISDDLYYILEGFGNIYQAVKIEHTIEQFYNRFEEIREKIEELIEIFDPTLNRKRVITKITQAIDNESEIIKFLKEEDVSLSDKFEYKNIDKTEPIFKKWYSQLTELLKYRYRMNSIDKQLNDVRRYYTGEDRRNSYLEFIEKVSFNEDDIINNIKNDLVSLREEIIDINENVSELTKKQIKLLNLDYERYLVENS